MVKVHIVGGGHSNGGMSGRMLLMVSSLMLAVPVIVVTTDDMDIKERQADKDLSIDITGLDYDWSDPTYAHNWQFNRVFTDEDVDFCVTPLKLTKAVIVIHPYIMVIAYTIIKVVIAMARVLSLER